MKQATTKRLFYNEWPIKIQCHLSGAWRVARLGPDKAVDWCDGKIKDWSIWGDKHIDKASLKDFAVKVKPFMTDAIKVRAEHNTFNIFCKDPKLSDKIIKELHTWVIIVTKPNTKEEWDFLLENGHKKVLCEELPFGKYRYKVLLKPSFKVSEREQFIKWLARYPDTIKAADSSERWLRGAKAYMQDPFVYVADDKTLSMVLLYLSNNHRKFQEFILKSSINT